MSDGEVFIVWPLNVQVAGGQPARLKVLFFKPVYVGPQLFEARADLVSLVFTEQVRVMGGDEMQAFGCLFAPVRGIIERYQASGVKIYHTSPGDLNKRSFWGFKLAVAQRSVRRPRAGK